MCTWQPQAPPAPATSGPYCRASWRYRGWSVRAASPGARYGTIPVATSKQPADAATSAASRRSRVSSRPRSSRLVHTLVAVSTWNRITSGRIPGSPSRIRATSGPARAAAPVHGSRSTNSSSTPSVIPPAAPAAPGGPSGPVTSGPVPRCLGTVGHSVGLVAADLILPPVPGSPNTPAGIP